MIKKKVFRVLTVIICILTLIMPHISVVLATAEVESGTTSSTSGTTSGTTSTDENTVNLISSEFHEGGSESSNVTSSTYDSKQYKYTFGGTSGSDVLKIVRTDDKDATTGAYLFSDAYYCLDGNNSFPSVNLTGSGDGSIAYTKSIADLFEENPSTLNLSNENYNSLCWLLDNIYLRKQMTVEQRTVLKDKIIKNAFATEINSTASDAPTVEDIKAIITDDDIEVIQQWAIWYFTNNGEKTLQDIPFTNTNNTLPSIDLTSTTLSTDGMETTRYDFATKLYQYYVTTALSHKSETRTNTSSVYPKIDSSDADYSVEGTDTFLVGPFKISAPSSDLTKNDYKITLTDGTSEILSTKYKLYDTNNNLIDHDINEVFDTEFYIELSISEFNEKNITLNVEYTKYDTKASVWTASDSTYQPLVLVTKEATPVKQSVEVKAMITPDFALRKYIIDVNGTEITDRKPDIDISKLKTGDTKTAEYKHKKNSIEVKPGYTVTYRISVYNEGNQNGFVTGIVDYLPTGLTFIEDNSTNQKYGWKKVSDNIVTTDYLKEQVINKFTTTLSTAYVDIVCKIDDNATSGAILTNIAEITSDSIADRDSDTDSIKEKLSTLDLNTYKGNTENKDDLSDANYYYKGDQDDDDFEKVKVVVPEKKAFDLSLQKFITKVNGKSVATSREPVVDTTPLKNGETNAKYTTVKTPVLVQKGDIVTYKIRVYNEGEASGYAQSVADYIPEGLGYLVNYKGNVDNYWALPKESNVNIVTLNSISNKDYSKILNTTEEISVAKGKVKLTTNALSSDISKTNNLLSAYDGKDKLSYKDIEVTCVVLADSNLKNIAEIVENADENGKTADDSGNKIIDRDSTPDTVNPDEYPGNDEKQDDNDYENLTIKKFDLSLQKFITGLNSTEITDRVPKLSMDENKKIKYEHPQTPLEVNTGDTVIYTIRVYNEGEVDGYASEITDNIPSGLTFDSNNEVNKKYGWKMYDSNGKLTTDSAKAVEIKTDYLSKTKAEARNEKGLLKAFDSTNGNLFYLDVKVAFKVSVKSANETIINIAEISKDADEYNNEIDDLDSTPGNKKEGEDDLDKERVHVGYFDLALQKNLVKAIITEGDKTKEVPAVNGKLMKVEIHRKKVNSTIVKFVYNITIKNEGTTPGYAKEIKDFIPEGLQFVEADNKNWKSNSDGTITTTELENTLIKPGETASVKVVLRWINGESNLGTKTNIAEISKDYNDAGDSDDIDSTPNNKKDGEDDIDNASVLLSISTGRSPIYIIITTAFLTIISTGIVVIKKYVL